MFRGSKYLTRGGREHNSRNLKGTKGAREDQPDELELIKSKQWETGEN